MLLKAYLERYRLDLDTAGNHPEFDSSARFQPCRRPNRLRDNDAACFVYGCHHGIHYTTARTIVNGRYRVLLLGPCSRQAMNVRCFTFE